MNEVDYMYEDIRDELLRKFVERGMQIDHAVIIVDSYDLLTMLDPYLDSVAQDIWDSCGVDEWVGEE